MKKVSKAALTVLKGSRSKLTKQQYKTLKGQILSGDDIGAMKGLTKILYHTEGGARVEHDGSI